MWKNTFGKTLIPNDYASYFMRAYYKLLVFAAAKYWRDAEVENRYPITDAGRSLFNVNVDQRTCPSHACVQCPLRLHKIAANAKPPYSFGRVCVCSFGVWRTKIKYTHTECECGRKTSPFSLSLFLWRRMRTFIIIRTPRMYTTIYTKLLKSKTCVCVCVLACALAAQGGII